MTPLLADADPSTLYSLIDRGGTLGLLCVVVCVIVVGGMRGLYAFRPYIDLLLAAIKERDERLEERDKRIDALQAELTATREELWRTLGTVDRAIAPPRRKLGGGQ